MLLIIVKRLLSFMGLFVLLLIIFGQMFWFAISKEDVHFLRKSIRNQAAVSFWINHSGTSIQRDWLDLGLMHFSLWVNPKKLRDSLRNFDDWAQEYALLKEATEEAVEDESYVLPPAPLPESSGADSFLDDPYDIALQSLVEDVWNSGFISVAGSAHLVTPIWAKPIMGWFSADVTKNAAAHIFNSKMTFSGAREDGADLLSWVAGLIFAHLDVSHINGISVHESVFDLDGEQVAALQGRLCDLGNLIERYCEISDFRQNPLDPLLYMTENFKAQFRIFWTLRGEHLIWANTKSCLLKIVTDESNDKDGCGESLDTAKVRTLSLREESVFTSGSPDERIDFSAVFMNQKALSQVFKQISRQLIDQPVDGAFWLFDFFQSAEGERIWREVAANLDDEALSKPVWGARLSWLPPERGELVTFAHFHTAPPFGEQIQSEHAEMLFNFMYGFIAAWRGVPRGPGRLERTIPWLNRQTHWEAVSEYSLGWREVE